MKWRKISLLGEIMISTIVETTVMILSKTFFIKGRDLEQIRNLYRFWQNFDKYNQLLNHGIRRTKMKKWSRIWRVMKDFSTRSKVTWKLLENQFAWKLLEYQFAWKLLEYQFARKLLNTNLLENSSFTNLLEKP